MKRSRKFLAVVLAVVMIAGLAACGSDSSSSTSGSTTAPAVSTGSVAKATGELYYLNFKPEVQDTYKKIGEQWKKETGNTLNVITAASGQYEQTLRSELAKDKPPVLFQINGPKGYIMWKDFCADLKDTELYKHLKQKSLAVTDGDGVYGLPYVVEGYGIIYNDAIMQKYFALAGAKAKAMSEINNFAKLKEVVEDMTAKKAQLGIKGVFPATSLKKGQEWRWANHLTSVAMYYEFKANNINFSDKEKTKEIKFQFGDNFKNIFDLYLNNSTTDKKLLGSKDVDGSMAEFALGQCAMVQNGNWAWNTISQVKGNTVKAEDVHFMPMYMGVQGEEKSSISVGTENFFAINKKAPKEQQQLAADFINWLYTSDSGKKFVTNDLKFIAPFDSFSDSEVPNDPLAKEVVKYMSNKDLYNIDWAVTIYPNQTFKDNVGASLLQYAQGAKKWDEVKQYFVDQYKTENAK